MASKRGLRRKSCEGKVRYETYELASHKAKASSAYAGRLNVYRCQFCKGWHIGHAPHWLTQSIRAKQERNPS